MAALSSAPCSTRGSLRVYLEAAPVSARDTTMVLRLCLSAPTRSPVNSLSGTITVDTTFARLVDVASPPRSPIVARADTVSGSVLVAGASGKSIGAGVLLTIHARLRRPGVVPRADVKLTELNALSGTSLVTRASVAGLTPRCAGTQPALFEVLPPEARADPGEPLDLHITGCAFHATQNTVRFGEVTLKNIRSTANGTRIRVVVPKEYRTAAEVPPMQMGPGTYDVSVNNGRGPSNAVRVTLR